jgi:transcriptional regulator with XRE-family HTH domain
MIAAEAALARRIEYERTRRGMSYEGLATRMSRAGCPIQPSAIYKIEKGDPPRRITVDELAALARVFEMSMDELLLYPEEAEAARRAASADSLAQRCHSMDEQCAALADFWAQVSPEDLGAAVARSPDWFWEPENPGSDPEEIRAWLMDSVERAAGALDGWQKARARLLSGEKGG